MRTKYDSVVLLSFASLLFLCHRTCNVIVDKKNLFEKYDALAEKHQDGVLRKVSLAAIALSGYRLPPC